MHRIKKTTTLFFMNMLDNLKIATWSYFFEKIYNWSHEDILIEYRSLFFQFLVKFKWLKIWKKRTNSKHV